MYVNEYAVPLKVDGIDFPTSLKVNGKSREELLKSFESASEGNRHTALTSIVGTMIKKNVDPEFAMGLALRLDRNNGHEPLPIEEVSETVDYLYNKYSTQDILQDFWSQGKEIYQIGFTGDKFFIEKIGKDKFNIIVADRIQNQKKLEGKKLKKEIKKAYSRLVIEKHIKHLARVDYLGNSDVEENIYEVKLEEGVIEVKYKILPVKIKDNEFIEGYLEKHFWNLYRLY